VDTKTLSEGVSVCLHTEGCPSRSPNGPDLTAESEKQRTIPDVASRNDSLLL